jgi:hypothetical protein
MMRQNNPQTPGQISRDIKSFILNRKNAGTDAPAQEDRQHLDTQMLFNDLENLLKNMDQGDARVQRVLAKLHELKTAVLLTANKN